MMIGKLNTYTIDRGETNVSSDPEEFIPVDEATRERWEVEAAEHTFDRIEAFEDGTAPHQDEAATHYEYDIAGLRGHIETVVDGLTEADAEAAANPNSLNDESPVDCNCLRASVASLYCDR